MRILKTIAGLFVAAFVCGFICELGHILFYPHGAAEETMRVFIVELIGMATLCGAIVILTLPTRKPPVSAPPAPGPQKGKQ